MRPELKEIGQLIRRGYVSVERTRGLVRWVSANVADLRHTREEMARRREELRSAMEEL